MIMEFLKEAFESVGEMQNVFGHLTYDENEKNRIVDQKTLELRKKLLVEELQETQQAIINFDKVEVADGLCDVLVVGLGAMHVCNEKVEEALSALTEEEMIKSVKGIDKREYVIDFLDQNFEEDNLEYLYLGALSLFVYFLVTDESLNLVENFREVHRTNMAKFFDTRMAAEYDAKIYQEERGTNCHVVESNGLYVIKREDGKVLKNIEWQAPNIIFN